MWGTDDKQMIREGIIAYANKWHETQANGVTTGEKQCNLPVVKARILDDLKTKAKEADAEADRIGAADRAGGFEKSGEAAGLEIAIEVVEQYVP